MIFYNNASLVMVNAVEAINVNLLMARFIQVF